MKTKNFNVSTKLIGLLLKAFLFILSALFAFSKIEEKRYNLGYLLLIVILVAASIQFASIERKWKKKIIKKY